MTNPFEYHGFRDEVAMRAIAAYRGFIAGGVLRSIARMKIRAWLLVERMRRGLILDEY